MNKLDEIFGITQEEAAEVIQAISKCRRFGLDAEFKNGTGTQRDNLLKEVGDLYCMLELLCEYAELNSSELAQAIQSKREKLTIWSDIFK